MALVENMQNIAWEVFQFSAQSDVSSCRYKIGFTVGSLFRFSKWSNVNLKISSTMMDRIGQGKRWQPFGEINSESVLFFHHAQGEAVWVAFFLLGTLSWGYDFDSLCKLWSIQMSLWSERMFRISSPKIGRHRNSSIQKFHCFSPFPVCQKHTSKLWVREDKV